MPSENTFFPESNSRNASVNAKIVVKAPSQPKPITVRGEKEKKKGVSILNHNKENVSKKTSVYPRAEPVIYSKANSFFRTSPRS